MPPFKRCPPCFGLCRFEALARGGTPRRPAPSFSPRPRPLPPPRPSRCFLQGCSPCWRRAWPAPPPSPPAPFYLQERPEVAQVVPAPGQDVLEGLRAVLPHPRFGAHVQRVRRLRRGGHTKDARGQLHHVRLLGRQLLMQPLQRPLLPTAAAAARDERVHDGALGWRTLPAIWFITRGVAVRASAYMYVWSNTSRRSKLDSSRDFLRKPTNNDYGLGEVKITIKSGIDIDDQPT